MALPGVLDPEDSFGLPKRNYSEVRDPRTDFDFAEYERLAVAVAMYSYTAPRAWCVVSGSATAGALVKDHRALWGETSAVVPTCTATATGVYKITWPASVQDLNPTASSVTTTATQFYTANACVHATSGQCTAVVSAANKITVYTMTKAGTAAARDFTVYGY